MTTGLATETAMPPYVQAALGKYEHALTQIVATPTGLLETLLARDKLDQALQKWPDKTSVVLRIIQNFDEQLRKQAPANQIAKLPDWRRSCTPPTEYWWWHLDEDREKDEQERNILINVLTGALAVGTTTLAVDIIRRLLTGGPDDREILITILILLLTASPFTKQARELSLWALKQVDHLPRHLYPTIILLLAFLSLVIMLILRLTWLPSQAVRYNANGLEELEADRLAVAEAHFRRAVAINSEFGVGYYHLANVYEEIGLYDEAVRWHQQAIESDPRLVPAYNNLGRLLILQGNEVEAIPVLQAGLDRLGSSEATAIIQSETEQVTRYKLLTNLGWAHFVISDTIRAQTYLEEAIILEGSLDNAFLIARPHFFLAQIYQSTGYTEEAVYHWQQSWQYRATADQATWQVITEEQLLLLADIDAWDFLEPKSLVVVGGNAALHRASWKNGASVPLTFGTELRSRDQIIVNDDNIVRILCTDFSVRQITETQSNPCVPLAPQLFFDEVRILSPRSPEENIPAIIYPRSTIIIETLPALQWRDTGANSYTVSIQQAGIVLWETTVTGATTIIYPTEAPSLEPGIDYLLVVVDNDTNVSSEIDPNKGLGFRLLAPADPLHTDLEALNAASDLDEASQILAQAVLLMDRSVYGEALKLLKTLENVADPTAVFLLQAEMLLAMQRPDIAIATFEKGLQQAQNRSHTEMEARILTGLWHASGNDEYRQLAITIYREDLGDLAAAAALNNPR